MSFEGDVNTNPGAGEISAEDIFGYAINRDVKKFKFESLDSSYIRYGEGFISQFDESASAPEYQTYSVSISASGPLSASEPT
jgi:hypothetical protein